MSGSTPRHAARCRHTGILDSLASFIQYLVGGSIPTYPGYGFVRSQAAPSFGLSLADSLRACLAHKVRQESIPGVGAEQGALTVLEVIESQHHGPVCEFADLGGGH
jgi:hypothetical protein